MDTFNNADIVNEVEFKVDGEREVRRGLNSH